MFLYHSIALEQLYSLVFELDMIGQINQPEIKSKVTGLVDLWSRLVDVWVELVAERLNLIWLHPKELRLSVSRAIERYIKTWNSSKSQQVKSTKQHSTRGD
jgi:hypothetical protein